MPQSEEAAAWFAAVCQAVQQIPYAKVCTYGHIARLVGHPERPRQVGIVMKSLPSPASGLPYHSGNVPWQRIINSKGAISPRGQNGAADQANALEAEGVEVGTGRMGERLVNLQDFGYFPDPEEED